MHTQMYMGTHRHTHEYRQTYGHTHTGTETHRHTWVHTQVHRDRHKHTHAGTHRYMAHTWTHTNVGRHKWTDTHRHTCTHRHTHVGTHRHTWAQRDTHMGKHTGAHRHTGTNRHTCRYTQIHEHTHRHTQTRRHRGLWAAALLSREAPSQHRLLCRAGHVSGQEELPFQSWALRRDQDSQAVSAGTAQLSGPGPAVGIWRFCPAGQSALIATLGCLGTHTLCWLLGSREEPQPWGLSPGRGPQEGDQVPGQEHFLGLSDPCCCLYGQSSGWCLPLSCLWARGADLGQAQATWAASQEGADGYRAPRTGRWEAEAGRGRGQSPGRPRVTL